MNDDERFLKDWLQDDTSDPAAAREGADQVMARVPDTKQRSRWWPLLPSRRSIPRPSRDGQPPAIHGRTRTMFSPVKAITAGALVFAIGGVLLIAQMPEQPPGTISGAAVDVEPAAFAGSVQAGPEVQGGFSPTMTQMSDPRLDGTVFWSKGAVDIDLGDYGWQTMRIENEDGAWQGSFPAFSVREGLKSVKVFTGHLVGEGDYEGLVAIMELDSSPGLSGSLWGLIVAADTVPEPPAPAFLLAEE